ncbi:Scr1 family TA system antitoxin-like transcriptional regulator [Actinosynnema sp. NPDC050436]|uniref:Scr1 family TA system antitoxin-like transcriptional regulator n=1 Tax=Actinosynnema sp. NPDC050436 TaxID=3155659 RepID=UPI0034111570
MSDEPVARPRGRSDAVPRSATHDDDRALLSLLCRTAERIDVLSPTGALELDGLDAARCTVYVSEGATVDRADVTLRVIPWQVGAYPGIGHVFTLFRLPGGRSVVHHPCPHGAVFTEDAAECRAAREVFDRLPAFSAERPLKSPTGRG